AARLFGLGQRHPGPAGPGRVGERGQRGQVRLHPLGRRLGGQGTVSARHYHELTTARPPIMGSPLPDLLCQTFGKMVGRWTSAAQEPGADAVARMTMTRLADLAGLNIATVSRALRGDTS